MNSLENLGQLLGNQLQAKLGNAKPSVEAAIARLEAAANQAAGAYGIGTFRAPGIDPEKSLQRVKVGEAPVSAVNHYVGAANGIITTIASGAYLRLNRKDDTPAEAFTALAVVEEILRAIVATNANLARLEAAANVGSLASGKPDFAAFDRIATTVGEQLTDLAVQLEGCADGKAVVAALTPLVAKRLAGNNPRVRQAINRSVERAKAGNPAHAAKVEKSAKAAKDALTEIAKAASAAEATDVAAVGEAAKALYGLQRRCPWYFGITPAPKKTKKPKAKPAANAAPVAEEATAPETAAVDPAA